MKFKHFSMLIKILPDFVISRLFAKGSLEMLGGRIYFSERTFLTVISAAQRYSDPSLSLRALPFLNYLA